jgi:hypothetical protein
MREETFVALLRHIKEVGITISNSLQLRADEVDRIGPLFVAAHLVAFWHKADIEAAPRNVRFRG